MARLSPEQIEAIVEDHATEVRRDMWKATWKTRFPELWAGGGLGILVGGAIGAATVASTLLVATPVAVVAAMFWPVVGAFAVAGMAMGMAGSTDVGSNVGAQLAEVKVQQRQRLLTEPDQVLKENAAYKKLAIERGEYKEHAIPFTRGSKKIYNWKLGLTMATAGLAMGAFLAATGGMGILTAPMMAGLFAHAIPAAIAAKTVACMTVASGAIFGAAFGLDFPTITANTTEFITKVFSGKIFDRGKKELAPEAAVPSQTLAYPASQITLEEAALLNDRLRGSGKNFTQTLNTQQLQAQPAGVTTGV